MAPAAALHALEEIRQQQEFVEARAQIADLRAIYDEGDVADANKKLAKMNTKVAKISASMREKYSIKTAQGVPVTRLVSVYNAFAVLKGLPVLPKIEASFKIPQFLRDIKRDVGFAAVYRNLMNDLATFGTLGRLRDILGRRVAIDEKAYAYSPKSEAPKYRYSHSPFKSPM